MDRLSSCQNRIWNKNEKEGNEEVYLLTQQGTNTVQSIEVVFVIRVSVLKWVKR